MPLWSALLGGSFVFLDLGPPILLLVFPHPPFFSVLWFLFDWQGFSRQIYFSQTRQTIHESTETGNL
jgi:hypothetical protein